MKKLAIAIALSMMAMGASAMPTVYGGIDLSIDYLPDNDAVNGDSTKMHSNSSFIGVKGEEKLTNNVSAVYQADWTIYADNGGGSDSSKPFDNRTRFIGLKDKRFGTVKFGQLDTPLKNLSSAVDVFNSRIAGAADVDGIMFGDNRISNSVVYESPKINIGTAGTLNVNGLIATGESDAIQGATGGSKIAGQNFGDAWSASAVYNHNNDLFLVGVGVDQAIPSRVARQSFYDWSNSGTLVAMDTVRVTGRLKLKDQGLTLKALAQSGEVSSKSGSNPSNSDIDKSTGFLIGAEYSLPSYPNVLIKTQYSQNETSYTTATKSDYTAKQYMLGLDYSFSKNVIGYAQAGYVDLTNIQGTAGNDGDQVVTGVGMLYKF